MSLGGMLAHRKNLKPTRKCKRCGLRYPKDIEKCTHCGELDEAGLKALLQDIEKHAKSNIKLGLKLLIFAGFLLAVLLLIAL